MNNKWKWFHFPFLFKENMKNWDETFIEIAGYNGTPSGLVNCDEVFKDGSLVGHLLDGTEITHHEFSERFEIHAEQNCLLTAAKNGISVKDCSLYITTAPCVNCAKIIIAAGIKKVIYKEIYKNNFGILLLEEAGIECRKLGEEK